jgi:hypothetical protein
MSNLGRATGSSLNALIWFLVIFGDRAEGMAATVERFEQKWIRQGFFDRWDFANAIVADAEGNVYVAGGTDDIRGTPDTGPGRMVLTKYDGAGDLIWQTSHPSLSSPSVGGMVLDAEDNLFVVGSDVGLGGFVVKYSLDGDVRWMRTLSTFYDVGSDVGVDGAGNIFMVGTTSARLGPVSYGPPDPFVAKWNPAGARQWALQYPESVGTYGESMAIDPDNNVLIAGPTTISKLDRSGSVLWSVTPGHGQQTANIFDIATDRLGNTYAVGSNFGMTNEGFYEGDAIVTKLGPDGGLLWQRRLQSDKSDAALAVAVDLSGNAIVAGFTDGNLAAQNSGRSDAFLAKFSPDGELRALSQFGGEDEDVAHAVTADSRGRIYVAAGAARDANDYYLGDTDALVLRFDVVPEPSAASLALIALLFARRAAGLKMMRADRLTAAPP